MPLPDALTCEECQHCPSRLEGQDRTYETSDEAWVQYGHIVVSYRGHCSVGIPMELNLIRKNSSNHLHVVRGPSSGGMPCPRFYQLVVPEYRYQGYRPTRFEREDVI
jgi:hypothetical protein